MHDHIPMLERARFYAQVRFTDGGCDGSSTSNGGAGEGTEKGLWDVRLPCGALAHVQCLGT